MMSTKDTLLADIDEAVAKRNNLKFEDYQKAASESFAADRDAEKGVINSTYDASKAYVQAANDKAVTDTKADYTSQYEKNAVQKIINEKQVAEKMSNLGLTDSGLNRTQQTAVQLSYANQKGKIDLARQSALDNLALNLTSALNEIETNRSVGLLEADQKFNDKAYSAAQTNYNNDLTAINNQIASGYEQLSNIEKAEIEAAANAQKLADELNAEIAKAEIQAEVDKQKSADDLQAKIDSAEIAARAKIDSAEIAASAKEKEKENSILLYDWKGETVVDDNGNELLKFIGNNGKTYNVTPGKNPYTNKQNAKIVKVENGKCIIDKDWQEKIKNSIENDKKSVNLITRACAEYGVFSNGYQPKGIFEYDKKGKAINYGKVKNTYTETNVNGRQQTIWYTGTVGEKDYTEWIWDGSHNCYRRYIEEE